jgi:glycosyltransferase involved in cell wall biosynthesis
MPTPTLAHDYLLVMRGAERTFAEMAKCWPESPIATLLYDEDGTDGAFAGRDVMTSALQRFNPSQDTFRKLLPLYPLAVRSLQPPSEGPLISSSSAFAHGIDSGGRPHVCYCHSPFRYVWHEQKLALEEMPRSLRPALRPVLGGIRRWDLRASRGVTSYIANSRITQRRIDAFYGRDSVIVHPPVDVGRFQQAQPEDWFLTVSEVVRHKRIEVALKAAQRSGSKIKVVGTGPDLPRLQQEYAGTAEFLGRVDDAELNGLYARSRALVVANVEEFGIAAVEAQAAGRPVLAADGGGAQETVVEGVTGARVPVNDVDAFAAVMRDDGLDRLDSGAIQANAHTFSPEAFRENLVAAVDDAV